MHDLKHLLTEKEELMFAKRRRINKVLDAIGIMTLLALIYFVLILIAQ